MGHLSFFFFFKHTNLCHWTFFRPGWLPCLQGYLFISVLVGASSELMKLVIQSIKNDLTSRNPVHINLALHCMANIGSREMADALGQEIPRLLVSGLVSGPWTLILFICCVWVQEVRLNKTTTDFISRWVNTQSFKCWFMLPKTVRGKRFFITDHVLLT